MIVQEYLDEKIDMGEVVSSLFGPIDEKINAARLDDVDFMDLWYSIIHSARRVPYHENSGDCNHNKLVDLIKNSKEHSVPNNEIYNYIYSEMTDFGLACREAYNDVPVAHNGFIDKEVEAWANLNALYALVTKNGVYDLSIYAIYALRPALEEPPVDDPFSTATQKYDANIPAAAAWVFAYGHELCRLDKDLTPSDSKMGNPGKGGELWTGRAGFSRERWALWKERFTAVGKMDGVKETTRVMARDAVEAMERSETSEHMR